MISTQPPVTSNPIWSMEDTAISEEEEEAVMTVEDTAKFLWSSNVGPMVNSVTTVLVAEKNLAATRIPLISK